MTIKDKSYITERMDALSDKLIEYKHIFADADKTKFICGISVQANELSRYQPQGTINQYHRIGLFIQPYTLVF